MPKQKKVLLVVSLLLVVVLLFGGNFFYQRSGLQPTFFSMMLNQFEPCSILETRYDEEEKVWVAHIQTPNLPNAESVWVPVQTEPGKWGNYVNSLESVPIQQELSGIWVSFSYNGKDLQNALEQYSGQYGLPAVEEVPVERGYPQVDDTLILLFLQMSDFDWAKEHVRVINIQCD